MADRITRRSLLTGAASVVGWAVAASAQAKSIAFIAGHNGTPPGNTVNFVTDFGAVPDGGAGSSDAAVQAFNTYFATATGDITLFVPTGVYNITPGTSQFFASTASTADSLTISAYGATFSRPVYFGHFATYDNNTHQARCQSVEAGSSTITLVTLADHPLFSVGDYALMTGLSTQKGGSPPNFQWFEYVKITAKDTGTGVCILTIEDPLVNRYLSTWPNYGTGSAFTPDEGGPATLYVLDSVWDMDLFIQGLTFTGSSDVSYAKFRHVELLDCTWPIGSLGLLPTACVYFSYTNCTINCVSIEADKLVTTLEVVNTTFLQGITFQSSSITDVIISGCTFTGTLNGNGGGDTSISDTTLGAWSLGPQNIGVCLGSHTLTNVVGPATLGNPTGVSAATYATSLYTHAGSGVFTIAKAVNGPQAWAVPGARIAVVGSNGTITQFTVMDVAESGANTVITTDLGGAFPSAPSGWGASVVLAARTTNAIIASGMSGSDQLTNLNNPGAQGLPLNSYLKKTLQNSFSPGAEQYCNGALVSFSINVTLAYAGATGTVKITPGQFHVFGTTSVYAAYDFLPSINAKVAGARVFRPGGVTGTQSGDTSMTAPPTPAPWMAKSIVPFLSASVADGTLTVVFEVVYDQEANPLNATVQSTGMFAATNFAIDAKNYYTPGNESPAVSTADYYHMHACQCLAPYDLDTMGADGAAVKAANGNNRYVWFMAPEHPTGGAGISRDACGIKIGFSNDPGVLPAYALDILPINNAYPGSASTPGVPIGINMGTDMMPSSLVYNPDDPTTPFYLYTQGAPTPPSLNGTQSNIWKSSDMLHWSGAGWSPKDFPITAGVIPNPTPSNLTSLQKVTRLGTGSWKSYGVGFEVGRTGTTVWTGTNGTDFVSQSTIYNYTGYPTVALTLSGTTLTAASAIFTADDVGKGVAIVYNSGNSILGAVGGVTPTRIATYVSSTQVTLNANAVAATLSAQTLPFQFGLSSVRTAPSLDPLGGTSNYEPSMQGPIVTIGRQDYQLLTEDARHAFQVYDDGMHATLAPIDDNLNISQFVPVKRIADYSGVYTGPGYIIGQNGIYEDGILHSYVELGYPGPFGANPYPFVGALGTGSLSGTTLTISAVSKGFITIGAIVYIGGTYCGQLTGQSSGTPGAAGTYAVENDSGRSASAGTSIQFNSGTDYNVDSVAAAGGFRQQFIQYITSVTDDYLAARAAPFGVAASCSSNTVTISWMLQPCRSGAAAQTYHVYRGTTAGTQATSIGTTAGSSITDTPTPGSVYYYRVVKIAGGIEQTTKYRIVHTYVG